MIAGMYLCSGLIYGLTWLGFTGLYSHGFTYLVWYIVAIFETALNIAVTWKWKVAGFKGTRLVQRMSLLAFIILGEGIIGASKSIAKLAMNQSVSSAWTAGSIGSIVAIIGIIVWQPSSSGIRC